MASWQLPASRRQLELSPQDFCLPRCALQHWAAQFWLQHEVSFKLFPFTGAISFAWLLLHTVHSGCHRKKIFLHSHSPHWIEAQRSLDVFLGSLCLQRLVIDGIPLPAPQYIYMSNPLGWFYLTSLEDHNCQGNRSANLDGSQSTNIPEWVCSHCHQSVNALFRDLLGSFCSSTQRKILCHHVQYYGKTVCSVKGPSVSSPETVTVSNSHLAISMLPEEGEKGSTFNSKGST